MQATLFDNIPYRSVVMLSGGVDSTLLAFALYKQRPSLRGVSVNYGQLNFKRTRLVTNIISAETRIPVEIMQAPQLVDSFSGFMDEEYDDHYVIMCENYEEKGAFIAITAMAGCWAAAIGYEALIIGYNKDDRDGDADRYADAPQIYKHLEDALSKQIGRQFRIIMPLWDTPKSEIVSYSLSNAIPVNKTWSCWTDGPSHCGKCPGCLDRKSAFAKAALNDPTTYRA